MSKKARPTLSLVMIVKDEGTVLARCLQSVKGVVDEMIVVDTGSSDDSRDVAESFGAKVLDFEWCDDFSAARNFGLENAGGDWVLQLDADEELLEPKVILNDLLRDKYLWVYYVNVVVRDEEKDLERATPPRLFRRRDDIRYQYPVHEHIKYADYDRGKNCDLTINHFGPLVKDRSGRMQRNMTLLQKAIVQYPDAPQFPYYIGVEHMNQADYENALPWFERSLIGATEGHKHLAQAERNIAWCLCSLGAVRQGHQKLRSLQERWPRFTDLYYLDAQVLANMGKTQDARALLNKCLQMGDPPKMFGSIGGTGSWRARADLDSLQARP